MKSNIIHDRVAAIASYFLDPPLYSSNKIIEILFNVEEKHLPMVITLSAVQFTRWTVMGVSLSSINVLH